MTGWPLTLAVFSAVALVCLVAWLAEVRLRHWWSAETWADCDRCGHTHVLHVPVPGVDNAVECTTCGAIRALPPTATFFEEN